jgi:hypothetical protein
LKAFTAFFDIFLIKDRLDFFAAVCTYLAMDFRKYSLAKFTSQGVNTT